jgi:hypothetical protein
MLMCFVMHVGKERKGMAIVEKKPRQRIEKIMHNCLALCL